MPAQTNAKPHQLHEAVHGGHIISRQAEGADELVAAVEGVITDEQAGISAEDNEKSTPFGYLFTELRDQFPNAHLPMDDAPKVVKALKALGKAMVEVDPPDPSLDSSMPAVYTYWGQFVDHDLTLNTDSDLGPSDVRVENLVPIEPATVTNVLRNLRQPALNLDSVYGGGPGSSESSAMYENGTDLKVGPIAETSKPGSPDIPGDHIPPVEDRKRDLPREATRAVIGDPRNDENLIVAQLHTAFLRFHNAAVAWVRAHDEHDDDDAVFRRARQLTQWHYQWLTVHDYLRTVTLPGIVDQVLLGEDRHLVQHDGEAFMPLEFSVAAFRFGHSMIRASYDYNRNFGTEAKVTDQATLDLLFTFTGKHREPFLGFTDELPFNWVIEWDRFVFKGDPIPKHFARRIDTQVVPPLQALLNEGNAPGLEQQIVDILKSLPTRNLLRGYLLAMPTGQAAAGAMRVPSLTADELQQGNTQAVNDALTEGGFLEKTPLWYYLLKEAEVRASGRTLGELGSRIVCETIIGQIREDAESYLAQEPNWSPAKGVRLPADDPEGTDNSRLIVTIPDFLRFAGVLV